MKNTTRNIQIKTEEVLRIKQIRLTDFKLFKNMKCDFNEITLLTGANSSGKSTVINALASIFQSDEVGYPFNFQANGKYIQLGGFKDIIRAGSDSEKFGLGITFDNCDSEKYEIDAKYRYAAKDHKIILDEVLLNHKASQTFLKWKSAEIGYIFKREINDKYIELEKKLGDAALRLVMESLKQKKSDLNHEKIISDIKIEVQNIKNNVNKEIKIGKSDQDISSFMQSDMSFQLGFKPIHNEFKKLKNKLSYSGPIRPQPSRQYSLTNNIVGYDCSGINSIQILNNWRSNDIEKFLRVKSNISNLGLASDLEVSVIKDDLAEIKIKRFKNSPSVNISDMGFGISQVLPVLIGVEFSEKNSTILVNQPEVHLHPSSQANLANFFGNEYKENNKKFIIETHSEYLINRFRKMVVTKEFDFNKISILYFEATDNDSKLYNITIDKSGRLVNAPDSFFETYFVDNNELIMAGFHEDSESEDE